MEPYVYTPLDGQRSFRLLRVSENITRGDGFLCDLVHLSLDDAPAYYTLSYAWGDDATTMDTLPLECGRSLRVTNSLATALPYIFPHCKGSYLWCDQVCIDQQNLDERSSQVALMGQIFSKGIAVLVWLGEGSPSTRLLIDLLKDTKLQDSEYSWSSSQGRIYLFNRDDEQVRAEDSLVALVQKMKKQACLTFVDSTSHFAQSMSFSDIDVYVRFKFWGAVKQCISSVLNIAWFSRLWVVQEVLMSQSVYMVLGNDCFSFLGLARLVQAATAVPNSDLSTPTESSEQIFLDLTDTTSGGRPLRFMARWHYTTSSDFDHSLYLTLCNLRTLTVRGKFQTSDPKDMIYALLGLCELDQAYTIIPNYRLPWQAVFALVARSIIANRGDLDILLTCDGVDHDSHNAVIQQGSLPSWVPDWRHALSRMVGWPENQRRSKNIHSMATMTRYEQLAARGKVVDTVKFVSPNLLCALTRWFHALVKQQPLFEAFYTPLIDKQYCLEAFIELHSLLGETGSTLNDQSVLRTMLQLSAFYTNKRFPNINKFCKRPLDWIMELYNEMSNPFRSNDGVPKPPGFVPGRLDREQASIAPIYDRHEREPCQHNVGVLEFCLQCSETASNHPGNIQNSQQGHGQNLKQDTNDVNTYKILLLAEYALHQVGPPESGSVVAGTEFERLFISHANIQKGDVVCLLRGFHLPVILRKSTSGQYLYVSTGCCEGLMDEDTGKEVMSWPSEEDEDIILV